MEYLSAAVLRYPLILRRLRFVDEAAFRTKVLILVFDDATMRQLREEIADELLTKIRPLLEGRADSEGWLDTKRAAAYLGISVTALHKLTSARSLAFSQTMAGAPCYFRKSELDAYRESFLRTPARL